jgi:lysophospholipase L1-like esterase
VSKASAARRLAAAAAYGGGGLGLIGGSLYGLLNLEAKIARMRIGRADEAVPDPSGIYASNLSGQPIRLAVLGDSAAAGYGASGPSETFGAYLAAGLAELAETPVFLTAVAKVGTQTSQLDDQIAQALAFRPHVCVLIIGANDVTHKVLPGRSVEQLRRTVAGLREAGVEVVVGTCPDLGTIRPIAPPLRQVARRWSRRLAAGQAIAVVEAGGRAVSLGTILGPEFAAAPSDMFGPDRFHPSAYGYRSCAAAMLPTVAAAIGIEVEPAEVRTRRIDRAAVTAAEHAGTEMTAAADRGRRRWALLRRRQRPPIPTTAEIEAELGPAERERATNPTEASGDAAYGSRTAGDTPPTHGQPADSSS